MKKNQLPDDNRSVLMDRSYPLKDRIKAFKELHRNDSKEEKHKQTFYNDFFTLMNVNSRTDDFEYRVWDDSTKSYKKIDVFWPKIILIEQKSKDVVDLKIAKQQATEYIDLLDNKIKPKYTLLSNFEKFELKNNETNKVNKFIFDELEDNIHLFNFMSEQIFRNYSIQSPVDENVSKIMADLYNNLSKSNPNISLDFFITRLAYCFFADDTGILKEKYPLENEFNLHEYLKHETDESGFDFGSKLAEIFEILNYKKKSDNINPKLKCLPFINGDLFKCERKEIPHFSAKDREQALEASKHDWSYLSPIIFGIIFQNIMDKKSLHERGAHFTMEDNIYKVLEPLFLNDLWKEFGKITMIKTPDKIKKLKKFHNKISNLKFLDPACGSGNFLMIAYSELRELENNILKKLDTQQKMNIQNLSKINVDQFYGIEINEFSSKLTETGLWMIDHVMNVRLGKLFGEHYSRIPIEKSPNIWNKDALKFNWNDLLLSDDCDYIFGNPPYLGANRMPTENLDIIKKLAKNYPNSKKLDYVSGWFLQAAKYINENIFVGFVATSSITQGEQVSILWNILYNRYGVDIKFAYTSFIWESKAKNEAKVAVVIIGFKIGSNGIKKLFKLKDDKLESIDSKYITPYLFPTNHAEFFVKKQKETFNKLPTMTRGCAPYDNQNYLIDKVEKEILIKQNSKLKPYIKQYFNAIDFINNNLRYILLLEQCPNDIILKSKILKEKINAVKEYRLKTKSGKKLAQTPTKLQKTIIPKHDYLLIPRVSSETRNYIPMGYVNKSIIPSEAVQIIENCDLSVFGLLTSKMHMIWLDMVGGRLEERLRYSKSIVYNAFPVPDDYSSLKSHAQNILDIRSKFNKNYFELYHQTLMPSSLLNAHIKLDKAVDKLYRKELFKTDLDRFEFLMNRYSELLQNNENITKYQPKKRGRPKSK